MKSLELQNCCVRKVSVGSIVHAVKKLSSYFPSPQVLELEPCNSTAQEFLPVILERIKLDAELPSESSSESSEVSSSGEEEEEEEEEEEGRSGLTYGQ